MEFQSSLAADLQRFRIAHVPNPSDGRPTGETLADYSRLSGPLVVSQPQLIAMVPQNLPQNLPHRIHTNLTGQRDDDTKLVLNPMAKEFVPPQEAEAMSSRQEWQGQAHFHGARGGQGGGGRASSRSKVPAKKKSAQQKQLEENVKRTIYICDIDHQVTEEQLASLFQDCGPVADCRVCGDANSAMRFAFIEFFEPQAVTNAISKNGTVLGSHPLRVLPSRTAIVPVNNQFLPRSMQERELCSRTVYVTNIDKRLEKEEVQEFFERQCGPVTKIRILGDYYHATRIAFVEFERPQHAKTALGCSGALLGTLPVRISPSKTPVREDSKSRMTPVDK